MKKAGDNAPLFQLNDVSGRELSLEAELAKGTLLLAFFKITCPTCQFTFPWLNRLARESRVPVLGVSQDDASGTRDFNSAFGVTFPTLLDSAAAGYPVSNAYGLTHVPSLFLIEPDGRIAVAEAGFSRSMLEEIGQRFGGSPFKPGERVPEFKPG